MKTIFSKGISNMTSSLLIVQFILAIILTITILLQKSTSIGLGAYSGSNDSLFGARGPASFLAKITMGLGLLFILNTLFLGYSYNKQTQKSVVDDVKIKSIIPKQIKTIKIKAPVKAKSIVPAVPLAPVAPATVPTSK